MSRVIENHERTVIDYVPVSINCDRCGKDMLTGSENHYDIPGTSFSISFGYGSKFDLAKWSIDICDDCAEWLLGEFKTAEVTEGA